MNISGGFRLGQFEVRPEDNKISGPAGETLVEPKCMDVLVQLAKAEGRTISRDEIISAVWPRGFVSDDVLTRCISQIRKALGDNAKSPKYLLTVRKRGYKLTVPVTGLARQTRGDDDAEPSTGAQRRTESVGYLTGRNLALLGVTLLAIALFLVLRGASDTPAGSDRVTVAVMPFEDLSAAKDQAWFASGMTEEIMNTLVQAPALDVVGRSTVAAFDPEQQDLAGFAARVGLTHVVEGSILTSGSTVRVGARLVRMTDGVNVWAETFDTELTDVVSIQQRISAAVIDELAGRAAASAGLPAVAAASEETDFAAYRLYLKGRYHLSLRTAPNLEQAIHYFEYALQADSKQSRTHSALASVFAVMPYYSASRSPAETTLLARQHANLALRLDANNAEAHAVLGVLSMTGNRDWTAAANSFERALALAPGSAYIANLYGDFFYAIGDYDSALEMEAKAARLDPLSAVNHLELGLVHTFRGEYEQAILQAEVAIELNDQLPNAWWQLFRAHFLGGNIEQARQIAVENADRLGKNYLTEARIMLAMHDNNLAEARRIVSDLDSRPGDTDVSITKRALWFAMAGEGETAARLIERAYASGDPILISPMHFFLPEDWDRLPLVVAALDKPELRELFELRRGFIAAGSGRSGRTNTLRSHQIP